VSHAAEKTPAVRSPYGYLRITCRGGVNQQRQQVRLEDARGAQPVRVPAHHVSRRREPTAPAGEVLPLPGLLPVT
jgi:hypothetical protein